MWINLNSLSNSDTVGNYLLIIFTSAINHHLIHIRSKSKIITIVQKLIYWALLPVFIRSVNTFFSFDTMV